MEQSPWMTFHAFATYSTELINRRAYQVIKKSDQSRIFKRPLQVEHHQILQGSSQPLTSRWNCSSTRASREQLHLRRTATSQTRKRLPTTLIPLRQFLPGDCIGALASIQSSDEARAAYIAATDIERPGAECAILIRVQLDLNVCGDALSVSLGVESVSIAVHFVFVDIR